MVKDKEDKKVEGEVKDVPDIDISDIVSKNFAFYEDEPTREQLLIKLKTLPKTYSVHVQDYVDFIVALPQKTDVSGGQKQKYMTLWMPYVQVAGRLMMFNHDMENRKLFGSIEPEPKVPEGNPPGWIYRDEKRLVYRVNVVIRELVENLQEAGAYQTRSLIEIGRRSGQAWVPWEGGGFVIMSNRFEKVETSAVGRALAQWGYGVLPGSGVASYDEMQEVSSLVEGKGKPREKTALINELKVAIAEYGAVSGRSDEEVKDGVAKKCKEKFQVDITKDKGYAMLTVGQLEYVIKLLGDLKMKAEQEKENL